MSPLTRSLLALAAAALLHSACAAPKKVGNQCNTESQGSLLGTPHNLPAVYIRPGDRDAFVDIPNPCARNILRVGLEVTACDDVAPTLFVPKPPFNLQISVHRNGYYHLSSAEVRVTLWCELIV